MLYFLGFEDFTKHVTKFKKINIFKYKSELFVPIIPPSIDSSPGSSGGGVSDNINIIFDNDDEQDHDQG